MDKYPRTRHLRGSRLQPGDEDLEAVAFEEVRGRPLVVEEKVDGANAAVSFDDQGVLLLQSRGHYLRGGPRERHFALFKTWANCHQEALRSVLGARYVLFGEWMYAKHTIFYDLLPHYFLEFDVFDREQNRFLSTVRRRELLCGLPIVSVPVLAQGSFLSLEELVVHVAPSRFKSPHWREVLEAAARAVPALEPQRAVRETDPLDLSEGLYVKWEDDSSVVARYKYVRASFLSVVLASDSHWFERPILPNQLAPGVDLYRVEP